MKLNSNIIITSPSTRLYFLYLYLFIGVLVFKIIYFSDIQHFEWVWRSVVLGGAVFFGYKYLLITTTKYSANALEIAEESGLFSRKVTKIPLNRITNYETSATFLERILGLSNVMIDTPGSAGFEMTMRRLHRPEADKVLNFLAELLGQQKIADAGDNSALKAIRQKAMNY